jgi:Zn-dependent peptidase ImmA (M78 family)/DNA-binding XRE family transcriptional regulator
MMIGERIRQARMARGLSLDALVERMGRFVTKQAISKYETGKSAPNPEILIRIAEALGVKTSYFLKEITVSLDFISYRKHSGLAKRDLGKIEGRILDMVESRLWLESLFSRRPLRAPLPKRTLIKSEDDVEALAREIRRIWELGLNPIENVAQTLEDRGMIVIALVADRRIDGVSALANRMVPVLVTNADVPGDRQRYNWAHELGHLVTNPVGKLDEESVAHRFAASFLAPDKAAISELGERRKRLELSELLLLKRKYGLSMQAWLRRALDLGVISESYYRSMCIMFRKKEWHREEPGPQYPPETPSRTRQLVLRALAEGIISKAKAEDLCAGTLAFLDSVQESSLGRSANRAKEIAALPIEERRSILAAAAEEASHDYATDPELTAFAALDGTDDGL